MKAYCYVPRGKWYRIIELSTYKEQFLILSKSTVLHLLDKPLLSTALKVSVKIAKLDKKNLTQKS